MNANLAVEIAVMHANSQFRTLTREEPTEYIDALAATEWHTAREAVDLHLPGGAQALATACRALAAFAQGSGRDPQ